MVLKDTTKHHWMHENGQEEFLSINDMSKKYGLSQGNLHNVANPERTNTSVKGWRLCQGHSDALTVEQFYAKLKDMADKAIGGVS